MTKNRCYMIDLDGTIYHESKLLPYAKEFIEYLIKENVRFVFFTNSPERTTQELQEKLLKMGIEITEKHLLTTSDVTLEYLKNNNVKSKKDTNIFVLSSDALKQKIKSEGYNLIEKDEMTADFVITGFTRNLDFSVFEYACKHILNGANLITTNKDKTIPTESGFIPHTGAINAFIEFATNSKAINMGKPHHHALDMVLKHLGCKKSELCIIGDNFETDISFGFRQNVESFLVYTGLANKNDIAFSNIMPTRAFDNLGDVLGLLKKENYCNYT